VTDVPDREVDDLKMAAGQLWSSSQKGPAPIARDQPPRLDVLLFNICQQLGVLRLQFEQISLQFEQLKKEKKQGNEGK
jgi:hypothetical protein